MPGLYVAVSGDDTLSCWQKLMRLANDEITRIERGTPVHQNSCGMMRTGDESIYYDFHIVDTQYGQISLSDLYPDR